MTKKRKTKSAVDFHSGQTLLRIARTYPTILLVILEQIQNALDEEATRISVTLNWKSRNIAVRDDGNGASIDKFEAALRQVCSTQKKQGKLGQFGIGVVSPLGKCASYTFTSNPVGVDQGYNKWTFVTNDIAGQKDEVEIPMERMPNLAFRPVGARKKKGAVNWRTEVNIRSFSKDRVISRIDSIEVLKRAILTRFSKTMRDTGAVVDIFFITEDGKDSETVRADEFTGRSLGDVSLEDPDGNTVELNLFVAQKTTAGRNGIVVVGESDNDYRFEWDLFAKSVVGDISKDVAEALSSGVFEGEITSDGVSLHEGRKSFLQGDALVAFCTAIEEWYERYGRAYMKEVREAGRENRYQKLGLRSLGVIEKMLGDPAFSSLLGVVEGFSHGTVGEGHTKPELSDVVGKQKEPSVSTSGSNEPDMAGSNGKTRDKKPPETAKEDHHPGTVAGPRGKKRTIVRKGSLGLQFSHVAMEGRDDLWVLNPDEGILHFNIRHPYWVAVEEDDRALMRLQEMVAIEALTLHVMPDEWHDEHRLFLDHVNGPLVHLLTHSASFATRGSGKKKK